MKSIVSYNRIDDTIKGIWSNRCNVCGRRVSPESMMTINECVKCFAGSHDIDNGTISEISVPDRQRVSSRSRQDEARTR